MNFEQLLWLYKLFTQNDPRTGSHISSAFHFPQLRLLTYKLPWQFQPPRYFQFQSE